MLFLLVLVSILSLTSSYRGPVISRRNGYSQLSTSIPTKTWSSSYLLGANKRIEELNMSAKPASLPDEKGSVNRNNIIVPLAIAGVVAAGFGINHFVDFNSLLTSAVEKISGMGPFGYVYFAAIYIAAEILAIPAFPLTASSGYLFGLLPGTLLVLGSATVAASISFLIGRTFLRNWAQKITSSSKRWRAVDKAIAKEGFKVILLLRLSPLLPFAVSNYLYGATSVDFGSFLAATFIGFAPGSFGFVYFGNAGKEIFADGAASGLPWYAYALAGSLVIFIGKTVAKVATEAINNMEDMEDVVQANDADTTLPLPGQNKE